MRVRVRVRLGFGQGFGPRVAAPLRVHCQAAQPEGLQTGHPGGARVQGSGSGSGWVRVKVVGFGLGVTLTLTVTLTVVLTLSLALQLALSLALPLALPPTCRGAIGAGASRCEAAPPSGRGSRCGAAAQARLLGLGVG